MNKKKITGYMCKIDWDYEIGNNFHGNKIYPSQKALMEAHQCTDECGIVKVSVQLEEVVTETNLKSAKRYPKKK